MEKIILDTDIGSDIDDAVCLAYLLKQPKCDLVGITTVSGEPLKRAMMASVLCKIAGKDVPIYPGVEMPLVTPIVQPKAQQAALLNNWDHDKDFPEGEAIEFMRRTIRANPGEITLLAIGPMTNVALLFAIDPEIPKLLKDLVLMCGIFEYKMKNNNVLLSEWNALNDPYATKMVYSAKPKRIRSIGLDVTTQVIEDIDAVKANYSADIMRPVFDFAGVWFESSDKICYHDPLAAATIFNDNICKFEKGDVLVETESSISNGLTKFVKSDDGINEVAVDVDVPLFFKHFYDVVGR
jgi:inosine-uridine nucleoside N-ribohydrolase